MSDLPEVAFLGVFILSVIFWLAGGLDAIKAICPKRAKPKILKVEKHRIDRMGGMTIELFIKNFGSKDCSLVDWQIDCEKGGRRFSGESTKVPLLIEAGKTVPVMMVGQTDRDTHSAKVVLTFDSKKKPIEKTIDLISSP